jgi:Asp/Glu/hydantoin racemase
MPEKIPVIGILMLDTSFFDVPGCGGSDDTFSFQVKRRVVKGASVERMTSGDEHLLHALIEAAQALEGDGVDAIIGDCGFMALFQKALQDQVKVPVFTSSLLLVPLVAAMIPKGKRVGILTYRADTLQEAHFQGAGWSSKEVSVAVAGVQDQSAWRLFRTPEHPFHRDDLERQLLEVSRNFADEHHDLGAIVLECTVMPPFAHKIQAETGLPVFDFTMAATLVAESLSRKPFNKKLE